jgi:hypothetical protein
MKQKKLHPSVTKFKEFVKNNPKIIQEVRKGNATWQELYEDWYLLGEEDKRWETIGTDKQNDAEPDAEKNSDWMSAITGMMKKIDPNQLQYHMNNLSQAIGAVQGLLSQFQVNNNQPPNQMREQERPKHPFSFRQD